MRINVDKGNLVGSTFIDLSKAFDAISVSQFIATILHRNYRDKYENGVVPLATSNVKLFLETMWSVRR